MGPGFGVSGFQGLGKGKTSTFLFEKGCKLRAPFLYVGRIPSQPLSVRANSCPTKASSSPAKSCLKKYHFPLKV